MSLFKCSICGQTKDIVNKANPKWKYCKPCWLGYQKQRRLSNQNGRNFSMALYKEFRKREGLPTNEVDVVRGRPPLWDETDTFRCQACWEELPSGKAHFEEGRAVCRICTPCAKDYEVHKIAVPKLTVKLYIAAVRGTMLFRFKPNADMMTKARLAQAHRMINAMCDSMSPLELLDVEEDEMTPRGAEAEQYIED